MNESRVIHIDVDAGTPCPTDLWWRMREPQTITFISVRGTIYPLREPVEVNAGDTVVFRFSHAAPNLDSAWAEIHERITSGARRTSGRIV